MPKMRSQMVKMRMMSKPTPLYQYPYSTVTAEMKYEFIDKVKKLTNEGLTQMVQHIQSLLPQSISDLENDKIQIKVDDFDKETFGKVTEFIEELIINEQPQKRVRTQ